MFLIYDFSIHRHRVGTRDSPATSLIESFERQTQRQHLSPPTRAANLRFSCVMTGRTLSAQPAEAVFICSWLRMAPWHSVESSSIFLSCDCKRSAWQLTRCPNTAVSNSATLNLDPKNEILYAQYGLSNAKTFHSIEKSSKTIVKISSKHPQFPPFNPSLAPSVAPPGARQLPSHGCVFAQAWKNWNF